MMRMSLILCTCNGPRFLPAQLEIFLTQTRLSASLFLRVRAMLAEDLNRHYGRYSSNLRSIASNLLDWN